MAEKSKVLKKTDLKLLSELMKNCRTSDRELAKRLAVSQPTISRLRRKLEEEGYIREYTVMPDFAKLGYSIMALTLGKLKHVERGESNTQEELKGWPEIVLLERGLGMEFDAVIVSFHKDYRTFIERYRSYPFIEPCQTFLIDLHDPVHYRPLNLSAIADHIVESEHSKN